MKITAMFFAAMLFWGLQNVKAQETLEITSSDKQLVAEQLELEASSGKHDNKTKAFLKKVAKAFKRSEGSSTVELNESQGDCVNCSEQKTKKNFSKLGRALGKGSAWLTTATAKPFINAIGFVKGTFEKREKNQDVVALYKFFLNHHKEFDELYMEAGTAEEMVELMLMQMEDIMERKTRVIMQDLLAHLGVRKELPEDLSTFELTSEEVARIDQSKISADFVNNHPEYQEVKPLIGEMTQDEMMDLVISGYFDKAISFENYKEALPAPAGIAATFISQTFVPSIALGIISNSLAGIYATPVIIAQLGTAASVAVCLQKKNQAKFDQDEDLKLFCSYVTNRSTYQLLKSRAKGYVAGKNFREKMASRVQHIKTKRAEKRKLKELKMADLRN